MRGWKFTVPEKAGSVEVTPGYQENTGGNENQEVTGEESTLTPEPTAEQSGGNTGASETPQPNREEASLIPEVKMIREQKNRRQIRKMDPENRDRRIGHAFLKLFVILLILVGLAVAVWV